MSYFPNGLPQQKVKVDAFDNIDTYTNLSDIEPSNKKIDKLYFITSESLYYRYDAVNDVFVSVFDYTQLNLKQDKLPTKNVINTSPKSFVEYEGNICAVPDSEYIYLSVYSESQIVKIMGTDFGLYNESSVNEPINNDLLFKIEKIGEGPYFYLLDKNGNYFYSELYTGYPTLFGTSKSILFFSKSDNFAIDNSVFLSVKNDLNQDLHLRSFDDIIVDSTMLNMIALNLYFNIFFKNYYSLESKFKIETDLIQYVDNSILDIVSSNQNLSVTKTNNEWNLSFAMSPTFFNVTLQALTPLTDYQAVSRGHLKTYVADQIDLIDKVSVITDSFNGNLIIDEPNPGVYSIETKNNLKADSIVLSRAPVSNNEVATKFYCDNNIVQGNGIVFTIIDTANTKRISVDDTIIATKTYVTDSVNASKNISGTGIVIENKTIYVDQNVIAGKSYVEQNYIPKPVQNNYFVASLYSHYSVSDTVGSYRCKIVCFLNGNILHCSGGFRMTMTDVNYNNSNSFFLRLPFTRPLATSYPGGGNADGSYVLWRDGVGSAYGGIMGNTTKYITNVSLFNQEVANVSYRNSFQLVSNYDTTNMAYNYFKCSDIYNKTFDCSFNFCYLPIFPLVATTSLIS
jgi:hypothetical protein